MIALGFFLRLVLLKMVQPLLLDNQSDIENT